MAKKLPWPTNAAEVIGLDINNLPIDFESSLLYALTLCPEKNAQMFLLRYRENKTCKEIGNYFGISDSRVSELIKYVSRRLMHSSQSKYLIHGITTCLKKEYEKGREQGYREGFSKGFISGTETQIELHQQDCNGCKERRDLDIQAENLSIDALGLSTHTYNALRRARIETVGDILRLDKDQLLNVPHFGKMAFAEVLQKMALFGFEPDWFSD